MGIRPTEDHDKGEFWVAIAGLNIDSTLLSTDHAEFTRFVRELSGFHALEVAEFITLTNYR